MNEKYFQFKNLPKKPQNIFNKNQVFYLMSKFKYPAKMEFDNYLSTRIYTFLKVGDIQFLYN